MTKIKQPYIIAETACSHDGSFKRLKKLIKCASIAGANSVQLQVWNHKNLVISNSKKEKFLSKIEISMENWKRIFNYTKKNFPRLEIIACVYDVEALKFSATNGVHAFKIHTSDLGNKELLLAAKKTKKRIDLSVGGSSILEIKNALKILGNKTKVWLMYGMQLFPTDPKNIKLEKFHILKKIFKKEVGYQDHSPPGLSAFSVPAAAIGNNIYIIEKHITDSRKRKGVDSEAALEPNEFKNFVAMCKEVGGLMTKQDSLKLSRDEKIYRLYSKKKIYYNRNLSKNYNILRKDIVIRQPNTKLGIQVDHMSKYLGKKLKKNVKFGQVLMKKHFN